MEKPVKLQKGKRDHFLSDIQSWMRRNFQSNKGLFDTTFKIKSLWHLKDLPLDWDLLSTAARFWDVRRHVYCFSYNELVPTYEDFRALIGGPEIEAVSIPLTGDVPVIVKLASFLQISLEEAEGMMVAPDRIDLSDIPSRFGSPDTAEITRIREAAQSRPGIWHFRLAAFVGGGVLLCVCL